MAAGTGNLPYPGKSYTPFDILTAEELNEDVANTESLATGAGIGDGAITASKIDWATFGIVAEETLIGKWVDGSNLYRRVISGVITQAAATRALTIIPFTGVLQVIDVKGYMSNGTTGVFAPFGSSWGSSGQPANNYIGIQRRDNELYLLSQFDTARTNSAYSFVIEYTR